MWGNKPSCSHGHARGGPPRGTCTRTRAPRGPPQQMNTRAEKAAVQDETEGAFRSGRTRVTRAAAPGPTPPTPSAEVLSHCGGHRTHNLPSTRSRGLDTRARRPNRGRARPTEPSLARTDPSGSARRPRPSRCAGGASSAGPPQLCRRAALSRSGRQAGQWRASGHRGESERLDRSDRAERAVDAAALAEVLAELLPAVGARRLEERSSIAVPPGSALPPVRAASGVGVLGRSVCSLPRRARPAPQLAPHACLEA